MSTQLDMSNEAAMQDAEEKRRRAQHEADMRAHEERIEERRRQEALKEAKKQEEREAKIQQARGRRNYELEQAEFRAKLRRLKQEEEAAKHRGKKKGPSALAGLGKETLRLLEGSPKRRRKRKDRKRKRGKRPTEAEIAHARSVLVRANR